MAAKLPNYSGSEAQLDGTTLLVDGSGSPSQVTGKTLTNAKTIDVSIVDGLGAQITSFGGGTQFADGVARGTATGTLMMGDDGANIQSVKVDVNGVLAIQDNGGSLTVDGTFFQATQPVSLAVNTPDVTDRAARLVGVVSAANLDVALSTRLKPADTLAAVTALGSITTSVTPGVAATNLGKAEDAPHATADTGVFSLGVRRDVPNLPTGQSTDANNDYSAMATDIYGVLWTRKRQLLTYTAAYRSVDATAGQLGLTFTFAANVNKQLATIHHTIGAVKIVRIRKVSIVVSTGAAGVFDFELRALNGVTAPATGNPPITPRMHESNDAAAEATCFALPTTAGTTAGVDNSTLSPVFTWNSAATAPVGNPSGLAGQEIVLYEHKDGSETKAITLRAGTAEGLAVNGRCTTAVALRFTVYILFTEE